jgi:hypothetical protein
MAATGILGTCHLSQERWVWQFQWGGRAEGEALIGLSIRFRRTQCLLSTGLGRSARRLYRRRALELIRLSLFKLIARCLRSIRRHHWNLVL